MGVVLFLTLRGPDLCSAEDSVLVDGKLASSFLSRSLLYNSWDFELIRSDDLERECMEEKCSYEEAREVFEDDVNTVMLLVVSLWMQGSTVSFYFFPKQMLLVSNLNLMPWHRLWRFTSPGRLC